MSAVDISEMSIIEKLQTMEALWDSLLEKEHEIESPEWHEAILKERMEKVESGKAKFISLDELKAKRPL